ncbi:hypothetical protein HMPREF0058_1239 [Actinomyces urogenitalis DSM 15434]|uniref:Uncharacterized protein n=1 Tax=Actinomyces urogenitalis DSM 15434 TaxID=525246 RepID=C0W5U5_9ACTO|nr:hypothetical protein [Actinomyces urogenitalis]EEH65873.1 hypothetical protein HMPREF0058_1239 [Actinomyces urogenitalis DSM 15434]
MKSGSRLRMLKTQRRRLAEELDLLPPGTNPSGVATLSRQLAAVCREIEALESSSGARSGGAVSKVDELAARRRDRARRSDSSSTGGRRFRQS